MSNRKRSDAYGPDDLDAAIVLVIVYPGGKYVVDANNGDPDHAATILRGIAASLSAGKAIMLNAEQMDDIERHANGDADG